MFEKWKLKTVFKYALYHALFSEETIQWYNKEIARTSSFYGKIIKENHEDSIDYLSPFTPDEFNRFEKIFIYRCIIYLVSDGKNVGLS